MPGCHTCQRVLLVLPVLSESAFFRHREGLGQVEGDGVGVVIRGFVQRHAAALCQCRSFQCDVEWQYRLITPHSEPVGMGMKQCRFHLLGRQSFVVGQGKAYPYLYASSTGTAKGSKGLREKFRLLLHELHFGAA